MNYYLEQAGVQKGFFTVKVGEKQQDYLYTDVRSGRPGIIPRSQYDSDYKGITGQAGEIGTYYDYKAGAIVIIDGEEYTVSERGTLDIPYGINIYDVKEDIDTIPAFKQLQSIHGLFQNVQLDQSRTCVYWNDEVDLPSDAIYEYGKKIE